MRQDAAPLTSCLATMPSGVVLESFKSLKQHAWIDALASCGDSTHTSLAQLCERFELSLDTFKGVNFEEEAGRHAERLSQSSDETGRRIGSPPGPQVRDMRGSRGDSPGRDLLGNQFVGPHAARGCRHHHHEEVQSCAERGRPVIRIEEGTTACHVLTIFSCRGIVEVIQASIVLLEHTRKYKPA